MLAKLKQFIKTHRDDIILAVGVILISLLSFAAGYIVGKQQEKEPIKIEERDANTRIDTNDTNNLFVTLVFHWCIGVEFI